MAELRHPAKFRQNRSNHGRDMAIFRFLSRLFDRVDLMKPVSNVRPSVRPCVRTYARPQKNSSILMKFGM